jgi:hypothetical protein
MGSAEAMRRVACGLTGIAVGLGLWLSAVHLPFGWQAREDAATASRSRRVLARHLRLWSDPEGRDAELLRMRRSNAEWDFLGRSFLVWALANQALREPEAKARYLEVMDRIIDETLQLEQDEGLYFFLMPYARLRPFVAQPARSQFLDGEIALMLAARRLVEEKPEYTRLHRERVEAMAGRMARSPVLSAESYPDECWTFCNALGLAAIRIADVLDGSDHSPLLEGWVETARERLIDPRTGLLVSSYRLDGTHLDGPEGSSIWMVAHALQLIDPEFARDQYARARRELGRVVAGFGYAREWPVSWVGGNDVDSGFVIPGLGASPGASGLALVGAAAFGDREFSDALHAALGLGAFPEADGEELRYCASNQVGDAVLAYSMALGPLWARAQEGSSR